MLIYYKIQYDDLLKAKHTTLLLNFDVFVWNNFEIDIK